MPSYIYDILSKKVQKKKTMYFRKIFPQKKIGRPPRVRIIVNYYNSFLGGRPFAIFIYYDALPIQSVYADLIRNDKEDYYSI